MSVLLKKNQTYETADLQALVELVKDRALETGKMKARKAYEESLTKALLNGVGPAHKMTAIDHMLPPLRLTIEKRTPEGNIYIIDPIEVAKEHSKPWEEEWGANDPEYDGQVVHFFKRMRKDSLEDAATYAHNMKATASKVRSALRIFSCTTAIGCDSLHLRRIANLLTGRSSSWECLSSNL